MSLLMKALEKAAKDRGEARAEPSNPAVPAESRPELSLALELLAADTPSPRLSEEAASRPTPGQRAPGSAYSSETTRTPVPPPAAARAESGVAGYVRDHPLVVFGILAALFALGFGTYVYLQIFHPNLLAPRPPAVTSPARIVQPAHPAAAPATPQPIPSAPFLHASTAAPTGLDASEPHATLPPATAPKAAAPALPRPASGPQPAPAAAPPPPQKAAPEPAPPETIVVSRGTTTASVSPVLTQAYAALQAGRLDAATQLYAQLAQADSRNIDALLGLATIAAQQGRTDDAGRLYLAVLELDPRHALAQSALIGLRARADPLAAESRLKQLIAREPSAFLYFTLGNVYADQGQWAQAQQAYFQAHHLDPENPDYVYNLAVGLEHVSQPRLAIGFYRRAVTLAASRTHVNFDPARARERISTLAAALE